MRMPEINSRGMRILQALRRKPMTLDQGIEAHGNFSLQVLSDEEERARVLELYCSLVDRGCIVKEGILYRLHLACRHKLEKMDLKCQPILGEVATKAPKRDLGGELSDVFVADLIDSAKKWRSE